MEKLKKQLVFQLDKLIPARKAIGNTKLYEKTLELQMLLIKELVRTMFVIRKIAIYYRFSS